MLKRLTQFVQFGPARTAEALSRLVAQRSVDEIHARLDSVVATMALTEARGYIRARAHRAVRRHVGLVAAERGGLAAQLEAAIFASALERAVHLVVRGLLVQPQGALAMQRAG